MSEIDFVEVEVAPGGDVVFTLSPDTESSTTTKLRVSSTVMSLASPVFKAMLERNFREATTLAAKGYVEFPLPEDPARPMIFLCKILHMDKEAIKEPYPGIEDLLSLSFLVDKYDCAATIAHSAFFWLTNWRATKTIWKRVGWGTTYEAHIGDLLVAAYLLQQEKMFLDIAKDLLMYSCGEAAIKKPKAADDANIGPLFDAIESRRNAVLSAAYQCIECELFSQAGSTHDLEDTGCDHNSYCRYEANALLAFMRMLIPEQLWPICDARKMQAIHLEKKMREFWPRWPDHIKPCSDGCSARDYFGVSRNHDIQAKFTTAAGGIANALQGLCMTCVRQSHFTMTDGCEHSSAA